MKNRTFLTLLAVGTALLAAPAAPAFAADTYTLDPTHTTVIWRADHFGYSTPYGLFSLVEGSVTLDEQAPDKSSVDVTVHTNNIFAGNPKFEDHLKNKDFFNVAEFPTATFKSTKVDVTGADTAKVTGDLTILGVTKPLTLDVKLNKKGEHFRTKEPTVGFTATGTIKRSEWGMGYGIPGISDDVPIIIEAEANKKGS